MNLFLFRFLSKHQYFDDKGVFISIIFSTPLLIFAAILVVRNLCYDLWFLLYFRIMIMFHADNVDVGYNLHPDQLEKKKFKACPI